MSDAENRKLSDLRVVDLRNELEKRKLDKTGIKQVLLERLEKALKDEGLDPDTHQFSKSPVKPLSTSNQKDQANDDEADEDNTEHSKDATKNKSNGLNEDKKPIEVKKPLVDYSDADDNQESDNMIQLTLEDGETFQDEEFQIDNEPEPEPQPEREPEPTPVANVHKSEKRDFKISSSKNQAAAKEIAHNSRKTSDKKPEGNASALGISSTKSASKNKRDYSQSRNLWITNIDHTTRATELKQALSAHGKVSGAKVVINAKYPGACCYGYVTMDTVEDANNCISKLNNTELNGHIIRIEKVRPDHMNFKFNPDATKNKKHSSSDGPRSNSKDPIDNAGNGQKSDEKLPEVNREFRSARSGDKYFPARPLSSRHDRDILTFDKIKEERERQRFRERERIMREESRRRREESARQRDVERMQRSEAARLEREREKLRMEREKLEREKAEIIKLERERQKVEREKLELEKLEIQRVKLRLQEEDRRSLKRPISFRRDDSYEDRKRMNTDRRYNEPPPMRFGQSSGVKAPSPPKKFSTSNKPRTGYDKRESFPKRDREFEEDRSHTQSSIPRGPPTSITKYEGSSVFSIGCEREVHDSRPRDATAIPSSSRIGKDSRYSERDSNYRPIRDDRNRRPIPEHKGDLRSRENRYVGPSKKQNWGGGTSQPQRFDRNHSGSGWPQSSSSKFNQSGGMPSKQWTKESWRPMGNSNNSQRWNANMSRGNAMGSSNFQGSNINLGQSCPLPPALNNYGGDYKSLTNIRKY